MSTFHRLQCALHVQLVAPKLLTHASPPPPLCLAHKRTQRRALCNLRARAAGKPGEEGTRPLEPAASPPAVSSSNGSGHDAAAGVRCRLLWSAMVCCAYAAAAAVQSACPCMHCQQVQGNDAVHLSSYLCRRASHLQPAPRIGPEPTLAVSLFAASSLPLTLQQGSKPHAPPQQAVVSAAAAGQAPPSPGRAYRDGQAGRGGEPVKEESRKYRRTVGGRVAGWQGAWGWCWLVSDAAVCRS
jgi:hypothetical protein